MADLKSSSRSRDLDKLLLRPPGHLVGPSFEPGTQLRDDLRENVRILVVGAGGLGCELLKELALSGFRNLEVIDMDRIEVSKLNRHFRLEDVGEPKAEVAAKRVMERVSGVNIVPHFCRIEEKELEFYSEFSIIVLALDSIEARSYINAVACGFLEYDSNDEPLEETVKAMVDGGFEGFKGHARVILPGITPCFECTIWPFPPQVKFPLCTLAETPITAAHCIEYAHLIKWDEVHSGKSFDPDNPEHMEWVYSEAAKRAQRFGIQGVAYSLTQGVVKNITRDIAAMYAIISAACAFETLKIASGCSKTLSNYLTYNSVEGPHTTEFVKDKECLVCGPGILIELDTSVTLKMFIDQVEEHPKILMSGASVRVGGKNLYMAAPPLLEEMTRSNLGLPLFELMDKSPTGIVHVTGTAGKGDKRQSCLRKLRVVFKVVDGGIKDTDMAGGCGEEHHTSYSFHKRNNLSCMRSRNIKDRIRMQYNGVEGLHTKATEFVKDKECLVCGPGILIELDTSVTLKMFIDQLEEHPKILMSGASVRVGGKNLYMAAPPLLEEMTRSNLGLPLFELMDKSPTGIVHVTGTAGRGDKRQSCLRKLRVVFKVVDGGIKDTDMAGGA